MTRPLSRITTPKNVANRPITATCKTSTLLLHGAHYREQSVHTKLNSLSGNMDKRVPSARAKCVIHVMLIG